MVAVTQSDLAHKVARDVLRVAPPDADIRRIWVWNQHGYVDPERDYVELTVMHGPLDDEAFQRFLAAVVDMMNECYPEANKFLHTFPSHEVDDLHVEGELRPGAVEINVSDL